MRRKVGEILPIEASILDVALHLRQQGISEFHGFFIASEMRSRETARQLTAHGTLYRALGRMEDAGLLSSRWEDEALAEDEHRPRRRLYTVTGAGELALIRWQTQHEVCGRRLGKGLTSS